MRHGYDAIAERYAEWASSFDSGVLRWIELLEERLPERSRVLELGCGGGGPATRALAARHDVVGVDISERQLERARRLVPGARYVRADATEVAFEPESFEADWLGAPMFFASFDEEWNSARSSPRASSWRRRASCRSKSRATAW